MTAPQLLSEQVLAPIVIDFVRRWPDVRIELDHALARVDLVAADFDVAVRVGPLADSDLYAKRLTTAATDIVAAPAYLAARPVITSPADLHRHQSLHYGRKRRGEPVVWRVGDEPLVLTPILTSSSARTVLEAAIAGLGVARLPRLLCGAAVRSGALDVVSGCPSDATSPIHALYDHLREDDPTPNAFVEALTAGFASRCATTRRGSRNP